MMMGTEEEEQEEEEAEEAAEEAEATEEEKALVERLKTRLYMTVHLQTPFTKYLGW